MEIVSQAANGREGVEQFRRHTPDITLMDLQMPKAGGLDAIIAIRELAPEARIIVLTTYSGDVQAVRALRAGARAYLLKNSLHEDLLTTIRSVYAGSKAMSPSVAAEVAEHSAEDALTEREIIVLRLIAAGHANKEIAARLSASEETIKSRVKNILSKLHANDRTHAAMIALRRGIIDP
jgi:DNA-binding NarL/FixJ family response regulator